MPTRHAESEVQVGEDFEFDGNYAEYLERQLNATLTGRMNIFVHEIDADSTEVKVRARYIVTSRVIVGTSVRENVWSFDTGGSDTIKVFNATKGTEPFRTLQPTHVAESSILEAIVAFGSGAG